MNDIVSCGHPGRLIPVRQRGVNLVVDIHCHMHVHAAEQLVREALPDAPKPFGFSSPASDAVTARLFEAIGPKLSGVDQRLIDMDNLGIDVQAISPSPGQYYYFSPPDVGRDAARAINDGIAQSVARAPDRLVGIGAVPLQHPELAIAEMRRCVSELDLRGIEINSNVNGKELADPEFRPFFAAAEELGILLFIHPLGFTHGHRLSEYYLNNVIGNPLEATVALSHLIFGGVLEGYSKLKICVAHGGGFLPAYWGRMDHAWSVRDECKVNISRPPSTYLRRIWLDTLVFNRDELDALVRAHGADKLCLGTDYPFDMSEPDPVGFHDRLSGDDRARILGLNAADLLGLCGHRH